MKKFLSLILLLWITMGISAQADTLAVKPDSLKTDSSSLSRLNPAFDSLNNSGDSIATSVPLPGFRGDTVFLKLPVATVTVPEKKGGVEKNFEGKEPIFYFLVFLLLVFGFLRLAFPKYFNDLFRVFFRTTLKQKQVGEQMLQSPLPSVLLNCFFVASAGMYINLILRHFQLSVTENFWMQYVYCMGGLALIYIIKFLGLKLAGWVFNVNETTESYIFIVFLINKILGVFLLPFLVLLAFSGHSVYTFSLYLSWVGIGLLLLYRFILSFRAVRKEIRFNSFHFILYIIAFEIIPLLLIYKLLLMVF
jgi:hypothetical protein